MTPNDFLELKGYGKDGHVTRSRKLICKLLEEYATCEKTIAYKKGYKNALNDAVQNADVTITYHPNSTVGEMPQIASCKVNKESILELSQYADIIYSREYTTVGTEEPEEYE
jgi:hypothetical protein